MGNDLPPQHQHLSESGGSEKRGKHSNSHSACSPNSTFRQPLDLQLQASGSLDARFNIDRLPAKGVFPKGTQSRAGSVTHAAGHGCHQTHPQQPKRNQSVPLTKILNSTILLPKGNDCSRKLEERKLRLQCASPSTHPSSIPKPGNWAQRNYSTPSCKSAGMISCSCNSQKCEFCASSKHCH